MYETFLYFFFRWFDGIYKNHSLILPHQFHACNVSISTYNIFFFCYFGIIHTNTHTTKKYAIMHLRAYIWKCTNNSHISSQLPYHKNIKMYIIWKNIYIYNNNIQKKKYNKIQVILEWGGRSYGFSFKKTDSVPHRHHWQGIKCQETFFDVLTFFSKKKYIYFFLFSLFCTYITCMNSNIILYMHWIGGCISFSGYVCMLLLPIYIAKNSPFILI